MSVGHRSYRVPRHVCQVVQKRHSMYMHVHALCRIFRRDRVHPTVARHKSDKSDKSVETLETKCSTRANHHELKTGV